MYEHHSGKVHTACDEYHVPKDVQAHVDYITPGVKLHHTAPAKRSNTLDKRNNYKLPILLKPLPMPIARVQSADADGDLSTCSAVMTPACIKSKYAR